MSIGGGLSVMRDCQCFHSGSLNDMTPTLSTGDPVSYNGTNVKLVVNVDFILAITATQPDVGLWIIILNDMQSYKIDVIAQSTVDFSYQFLEEDDQGVTYPAVGSPIAGKKV